MNYNAICTLRCCETLCRPQVSLLYRSEAQPMMPVSVGASRYSLQVADILPSIGIMHSMTTGDSLILPSCLSLFLLVFL